MNKMKKDNVRDYQNYIFDMDGTLYFHTPLRITMALCLSIYYGFHPRRWRELLLLRSYRKMREEKDRISQQNFEEQIRKDLQLKYGKTEKEISDILEYWLLKKPVKYLYIFRDQRLQRFLKEQKRAGKGIYIYSDYPSREKCKALKIEADGYYEPDGQYVLYLKPEPSGLKYLTDHEGIEIGNALFIGDRFVKDGLCAEGVGMDYVILKKDFLRRKLQYRKWKEG